MLPDTSIDHSPLLISLLNNKSDKNDNGFSKLNNSLVCDKFYIENMKKKKKKIITKTNNWNEFKENA